MRKDYIVLVENNGTEGETWLWLTPLEDQIDLLRFLQEITEESAAQDDENTFDVWTKTLDVEDILFLNELSITTYNNFINILRPIDLQKLRAKYESGELPGELLYKGGLEAYQVGNNNEGESNGNSI